MFPSLELGKHLAANYIGSASIPDVMPQVTNIDKDVDAGDIDPFKS
jgi:hypothetical protein